MHRQGVQRQANMLDSHSLSSHAPLGKGRAAQLREPSRLVCVCTLDGDGIKGEARAEGKRAASKRLELHVLCDCEHGHWRREGRPS